MNLFKAKRYKKKPSKLVKTKKEKQIKRMKIIYSARLKTNKSN